MVTAAVRSRRAAVWLSVTLLVGGGAGLGACASAPDVPLGPDGRPDPVLEVGRDVFAGRCATCHGTDGGGGRGVKLADGAAVAAYPDIEDMIAVVANGKGGEMPAFADQLDTGEIEAVVRYVREVL